MADRSKAGKGRPDPAPDGPLRAVWAAPLWAHLAALALVLSGLLAAVGTSSSFSADEGAVVIQARSLSEGRGWVVPHPMPAADPAAVNYPLELSERGPRGAAPYGKHPLYALLLAGADHLGGVAAMVLLSLGGAVAAAGFAAALARRLDPVLARPSVWVVGLASPLLFDGFLLIAHTLGAAFATAAVLAAAVAIDRRSPARALFVVPAVVACVLLRNEGLFIALALAGVTALVALRRPLERRASASVAVGALLAGGGAHFVDGRWTAHLLGGGGASGGVPAAAETTSLIAGRVQGLLVTWLTPDYGGHPLTGVALLAMFASLAVGALTVRQEPGNRRRIAGCSVVASLASLVAYLAGPTTVVPGLLLAFPLLTPGALLVRRSNLHTPAAQVAAGVCVFFAAAVLATQYAKGGGGEWGGRYFTLAIPIAVPVLLLALRDQRSRLDARSARAAVVALAICSVALSTIGISAMRSAHRANARLVASVDRAGRAVAVSQPVMVTTEGAMPRFAWSTFDRQRWLLAQPGGLDDLLGRLRAAGVATAGFVTRDLERDQAVLDHAGVRVLSRDRSESARRWQILVLQIA